jgi:hypothetical protein
MMLRANSRLRSSLPHEAIAFLQHAAGAIERILPHVEVEKWKEGPWIRSESVWASSSRTEIRATISVGDGYSEHSRSFTTIVRRRRVPVVRRAAGQTLDTREFDICRRVVLAASHLMQSPWTYWRPPFPRAVSQAFDESIVAFHLTEHHDFGASVESILASLHTLSEQSYENKSLSFGCIVERDAIGPERSRPLLAEYLMSKKYKALSDGYRTAYRVSSNGRVLDFADLERIDPRPLTEKHFYPEWAQRMARASRSGRCGIALSRHGDILVLEEGSLRFTYRYGRWQYWNHAHLLNLLRDRAKAQRVPREMLGRVISTIYRAALDVSFRRTGGLFLILHNRKALRKVVRAGDALQDKNRSIVDRDFDAALATHTIQALPRPVLVELASLDGALVIANSGHLLAYGAVLNPRRAGTLRGSEGSRTKAAIGASNYGLSVKVSADGDINVYSRGREFIRI